MPIDVSRVAGAQLPAQRASWVADDVILYHLGLGAGRPPTDPNELEYTYEANLKVLPTFGVIAASRALTGMLALPGLDVDLALLLHGDQEVELHDRLPAEGDVRIAARVADVLDKGSGALVTLEATTTASADGRPLCTSRFGMFFRGEGGFGGEPGPAAGGGPPDRPADRTLSVATMPQQALLYRLSGDKNPLHADPAFAALVGFGRPILHGLCTYGMVCKAVVDAVLDGDVARVARYRARFAGVVFPGETIDVSIWDEGGQLVLAAACAERGTAVLSNAAITLR